ncbi:PaaI family thioesterase [Mangrovihabitans endophyticus]|uniref:Thioesterase n=1 Tax=Mangrovihabitans endophyticus TaxID=1751298 RepID=A0A8J3FNM8_9ACTN|nr:PaaI family thioesterase [Mangrovihabitans endophyticus]GGK85729.1 thioesterase [Mangrovihabitans endophyticus]
MTETQRSRTFTWTDPAAHVGELGRLSGLDMLRSLAKGDLPRPPVMELLDAEGVDAEHGRVTFALEPREFHYNPLGTVHGGVISTMLDTAAACAVHSMLPAGVSYTTLDLNVKFLRPVTVESGRLTCTGEVIQRGRRTALAQARMVDTAGRLVAHATSSCMILEVPGAAAPAA